MNAQDELKFTLLENGLDYIASALENLGGMSTKRQLKYGLLHMAAGIELVLKERLRREDWTLVFEISKAARKETYESGNFRSVGLEACLERLAQHCGVDIPDEAAVAWLTLRKRRNPLEHYDFSSTTEAIKALTSKALGFLVDFMGAELDPDQFGKTEHEIFEVVRKRLRDFDAFVDERTEAIASELAKLEESGRRVLTCPSCLQHALVLDAESCLPSCLFCRYRRDGERAADDYVAEVFGVNTSTPLEDGGAEWPVWPCVQCGLEALVDCGEEGSEVPDRRFICVACANAWADGELDFCAECRRLYDLAGDTSVICQDCLDSKGANE